MKPQTPWPRPKPDGMCHLIGPPEIRYLYSARAAPGMTITHTVEADTIENAERMVPAVGSKFVDGPDWMLCREVSAVRLDCDLFKVTCRYERKDMGMNEMPTGQRPPPPPNRRIREDGKDMGFPAGPAAEDAVEQMRRAGILSREEVCRSRGLDWQEELAENILAAGPGIAFRPAPPPIRAWAGDGKTKTYIVRNAPYDVCYQGPPADFPASDPRHGTTDVWGVKARYTLYPSDFPWWTLAATLGGLATIGWMLANG